MSARLMIVLLPLLLLQTACQQDSNSRGPIEKGARDGSARIKNNKNCKLIDGDCMNLVNLKACLKQNDNAVARTMTVDMNLFAATEDYSKLTDMGDTKLLAQVINDSADLKPVFESKKLKDARANVDVLNAEAQVKCESVALKDEHGNLQQYTIASGKLKNARMVLKANVAANGWRLVEVADGMIRIRTIRPLDGVKRCGNAVNVLASVTNQINYGGNSRGQLSIGSDFAKLMAEHTDSSDNLKQAVAPAPAVGAKGKGEQNRGRKASASLSVNESVYMDAISRVQKGQLKGLECGTAKVGDGKAAAVTK